VRVDAPEGASDADVDALFATKKPLADALLAKVRAGEDFAALAESSSEDYTSRARGGKMDVFDKDGQSVAGSMYDMNYVSAAIALKEGEVVTAPVRTQFGWHIIKLDGLNVPTFDEQIRKARTDAYEKWIADQTLQFVVSYNIPATATVETVATDVPAQLPTAPLGGYPTATATVAAPTATATP
jgi:peptidyl-prolyl cis-trans isomerase D